MASVRVAVRVRPLDEREKNVPSKVVVEVKADNITIYKPICRSNRGEEPKTFSFDFSYDSTDPNSSSFASQEKIYKDLGSGVIKAAFEGFNTCIFAYGQTGSGKSYTMMGQKGDKGLIPRICEGLFQQIAEKSKSAMSFHTEVSFLEIYNERVQDLLQKTSAPTDKGHLKVREHPKEGPYVQNLTRYLVQSYSDVEELILLGNSNRTTASTDMNDSSSRSHAIFTIRFTRAWFEDSLPCETVSKIHLVDLAGSERADATRATGTRLKEGANINKSLVTLGCVISTLVLFQNIVTTKRKKQIFIPYRDSVLTWLLKDSLGGNSKTTMIATISPAEVNYTETLSTLHYASRAKNIVNSPKVNEDHSVKVIRGLQAEIERLRKLLEEANQIPKGEQTSCVEVAERLHENEAKVAALTRDWASKWNESHNILKEETVALRKRRSGVVLDCQLPHLIGIDEDLLGSGIILYYLKKGQTSIGSNEALCGQDIVLQGLGILGEHCELLNQDGAVTLTPHDGALCLVNGSVVTVPCQLTQGTIIQLGKDTMFRFNHPTEAAILREKRQSGLLSAVSLSLTDTSKTAESLSKVMLQRSGAMECMCSLSPQGAQWQQDDPEVSKSSEDIKGFESGSSRDPLYPKAEASQGAQTEEPGTGSVNVSLNSSCSIERPVTSATPVKSAVPHSVDGEAHQGGVRTRDRPEQEGDRCHKSGPELTSEGLRRGACCGGEVRSGDASLQQTSVPGRGDGCGTGPVGSANEIQEVTAHCNEGRRDSGGNSLSGVSHLPNAEGGKSAPVPQQASTLSSHSVFDKTPLSSQAVSCPTNEVATREQSFYREMDGDGEPEGVLEVRAKPYPGIGLGSLVNAMSWIVQGTSRRILNSSIVLQHALVQRLYPASAGWSSHVVSMIKNSKVISVVKDSYITSLFSDIQIFSLVKDLPLVQHIQFEMTQHLQAMSTIKIQECTKNCGNQIFTAPEKHSEDTSNDCKNTLSSNLPQDHDQADEVKLKVIMQPSCKLDEDQTQDIPTVLWCKDANIFFQSLITFPDSLMKLQSSHSDLGATLQSIIPRSLFTSQKIVALFWLEASKSASKTVPALLILMEAGLYTVTDHCGALEVFYQMPLAQLKKVHIGFAGHSLSLLGPTEERVLGLYTYSQSLTRELCGAVLRLLCPSDTSAYEHPLLHGDLMDMSLKWQALVPDLLLDTGLRVLCRFQRSLADLMYLLHCNTSPEQKILGEVRLHLYFCVGIWFPSKRRLVGQVFVTDTHIGLVQEDIVFPPVHSVSPEPSRLHFHSLTVRRLVDVRGVVVREEDLHGAVTVDVILANVKARGHPERGTGCAHPSSHAQVWKLTLSCSAEAARLINHLSNV